MNLPTLLAAAGVVGLLAALGAGWLRNRKRKMYPFLRLQKVAGCACGKDQTPGE